MEPTNNTNNEDTFVLFSQSENPNKEEAMENSQSDVEMMTDEDYLIDCARYNDFEELKKLLEERKDININYQDGRQNTALRRFYLNA